MIKEEVKQIIANAKFGDKFRTRNGRMAIFLSISESGDSCNFIVSGEKNHWSLCIYKNDGGIIDNKFLIQNLDIVSIWEEPIDEKELDKLSKEYSNFYKVIEDDENGKLIIESIEMAYKEGYRKAMEEMK